MTRDTSAGRSDDGPVDGSRKWLFLVGAIASEVAATLALRAALDARPWFVLVVAGYVAAFTMLALVLREGMPIGVAYGIWGASGVAVTAVLAALLFGDPLTWLMGLGVVAVAGGVMTVEIGAQRATAAREQAAAASASRTAAPEEPTP
ncbi:SMR family transporter [Streptomyces sp. NBC_01335]|uniref:DMT family transporter n=1 Tax=Streptomyces sp. NBC_01335 TaxID=2903828 RepID=UPI002E107E40|nr:SMR family transporter [Streptomyces sp. NBC_01335]